MKQRMIQSAIFILAALLTTTAAWADTSPIGTLKAQGKVTIEAPDSTFTLTDQEYAYFSGDAIQANEEGDLGMVMLNEGLTVTFIGAAKGRITRQDEGFHVELEEGHIVVDAENDVQYRILHNGQVVTPDETLAASAEPFVVSVTDPGQVSFYSPAQLDESGGAGSGGGTGGAGAGAGAGAAAGAGLTLTQIAAVIAVVSGAVVINDQVINDDDGPSS